VPPPRTQLPTPSVPRPTEPASRCIMPGARSAVTPTAPLWRTRGRPRLTTISRPRCPRVRNGGGGTWKTSSRLRARVQKTDEEEEVDKEAEDTILKGSVRLRPRDVVCLENKPEGQAQQESGDDPLSPPDALNDRPASRRRNRSGGDVDWLTAAWSIPLPFDSAQPIHKFKRSTP
jgi:hypothetical protein